MGTVRETAHILFGVFGNLNGLLLFLAPTITFKRIIMKRSTEHFSAIPYVMTLLNCLLSAWYGLPLVSKNNILVSTINATGAAIDNNRKLFCGLAASLFSIVMYASPLSVVRMVIKTKSVEFMPFFLSLFVFLCGTSWFIYGLLGRDPYVAVPNGFGCGLGTVQLILYAIYRDKKPKMGKPAPDESSLEMGSDKPLEGKLSDGQQSQKGLV
ncbi:nodulin MtN3 family protein [Actinidia rufa]|uniref:Nodulin MtN3 family protein n=1 Tax=Actinidia rufa TaxID=165716 RepID=A0A7J0DN32_9ERIC|nr:nodulin MtN3 family protein [Actinidia rufa]